MGNQCLAYTKNLYEIHRNLNIYKKNLIKSTIGHILKEKPKETIVFPLNNTTFLRQIQFLYREYLSKKNYFINLLEKLHFRQVFHSLRHIQFTFHLRYHRCFHFYDVGLNHGGAFSASMLSFSAAFEPPYTVASLLRSWRAAGHAPALVRCGTLVVL